MGEEFEIFPIVNKQKGHLFGSLLDVRLTGLMVNAAITPNGSLIG